ncbi:hypothetical protein PINS_up013553 [Pythium insidiosum]|nr:hypothetical protein PINS_up013553 [Pythium insidiosum]
MVASPSPRPAPQPSGPRVKEIAPFLKSLRCMLDHESDDIIRWTPDGRAFEIHDLERMTESILPKYFKHSKYTSFQRQLNYFNFRKWTKSKAVVCTFSNPCFVRDAPDLEWHIARKKPSASGKRSLAPVSVPKHHELHHAKRKEQEEPPLSPLSGDDSTLLLSADSFMISALFARESECAVEPVPFAAATHHHRASTGGLAGAGAAGSDESLDWIDTLYPTLDLFPHECELPFQPLPMSLRL